MKGWGPFSCDNLETRQARPLPGWGAAVSACYIGKSYCPGAWLLLGLQKGQLVSLQREAEQPPGEERAVVGAEGRRAAGCRPTADQGSSPFSHTVSCLDGDLRACPRPDRGEPATRVQWGSSSMGEQPKKKLVLLASARFFFFPGALFS